MFSETYEFGSVETHQIILDEISRWINNPKSQKHIKFGKEILEKALELAQGCMGNLQDLTDEELTKKTHQYSSLEKKNPPKGAGKETSKEDKHILALAQKNKANIATQDMPLTSLSKRVTGEGRVYDFADMVLDLFNQKKLSKEDIEGGLYNLDHFNDRLSSKDNGRIIKAINKIL